MLNLKFLLLYLSGVVIVVGYLPANACIDNEHGLTDKIPQTREIATKSFEHSRE